MDRRDGAPNPTGRGARIREAMRRRGYGKALALASELGVSTAAVSKWQNDGPLSLEKACELAVALDISLDWLLLRRGSLDWNESGISALSMASMDFYVFQKQAAFTGVRAGQVRSSSLGTGRLPPYKTSNSQLEFEFDPQVYAGASRLNLPTQALVASQLTSSQPVDLTPAKQNISTKNQVKLTVDNFALAPAIHGAGVPKGNFAIAIPSFTPSPALDLRCGCAANENLTGRMALASFVAPSPASQLYCAPVSKYFVKVGSYQFGEDIEYSEKRAGLCDFSGNSNIYIVNYNPDGTYYTKGI